MDTMELDGLPPDIGDVVEEFDMVAAEDTKIPVVYVLYLSATGEALYVGQTDNLHMRMYEHLYKPEEGNLRSYVDADDELDIETGDGKLWGQTDVRWMRVDGGEQRRRSVEKALEARIGPRYEST